MSIAKNTRKKYRVKGLNEFAFATQTYAVRKTSRQDIEKLSLNKYQVTLDKESFLGEVVAKKQNNYTILINGNTYHFRIEKSESVQRRKQNKTEQENDKTITIKAPMPGKICEVFVSKGIEVKVGEPLLILEAMKMQNQILASATARTTAVHIRKNENVLSDQILIEMERIDLI